MRRATLTTKYAALLALFAVAALAPLTRHAPSDIQTERDDPHSLVRSRNSAVPLQPLGPRGERSHAAAVSSEAEMPGAAAKLFLEGLTKDFGTVPHGAQLRCSFPITNICSAPITIAHLQPSCGCLTAAAEKRNLGPHESATVDVRMDTGRFFGRADQSVRVKIVGPDFESTCKLRVLAVSGVDVVFKPRELVFRDVVRGQESSQTVDVEFSGPEDLQIKEVQVDKGSPFSGSLRSLYRRHGKIGYRLTVTLKADPPPGTTRSFLYLKSNPVQDPVAALPIVAIVPRPLAAVSKSN